MRTHSSRRSLGLLPWLALATLACQAPPDPAEESVPGPPSEAGPGSVPLADVVSVTVSGEPRAYLFEVGVESPDLGCQQYADWWEVVGEDERLIHRRLLAHSHLSEQPFVRSGGPVMVAADTVVTVRAHMHPTGYGGTAFVGSVRDGFRAIDLPASFAADLADQPPRPPPCAN